MKNAYFQEVKLQLSLYIKKESFPIFGKDSFFIYNKYIQFSVLPTKEG